MVDQLRLWALASLVACTMLGSVGCTGRPQSRSVLLTDADGAPLMAIPSLEVANRGGNVTVIVDPRERNPRVIADIYPNPEMTKAVREQAATATDFTAEVVQIDGRPVIRVLGGPPQGGEGTAAAEITIRLASCRGVTVRNAGGSVHLINVGGAINVENGAGGGPGGGIIVRTGQPILDPVTLTTTAGDVFLQVPPTSTGQIDLLSLDGEAVFRAEGGRLAGVVPEFSSYKATLSRGQNPIVLRSGRGMVRMTVKDRAGTHVLAD